MIERRTKTSEKVITEEGLLAAATASNDDLLDSDEMEVTAEETNDEEENNLSEPDPEPGQRSPRDAQKKKEKENRHGITSNQKYEPQHQKKKKEPKTPLK